MAELAGWTAFLVVPPAVYFAGVAVDIHEQAALFAAILTAAVILWVFSLVDEFVPPLAAVVASLFVGLAPTEVALGGFASPTFLSLLGVFALAAAMRESGLSRRVLRAALACVPDRPFFTRLVLLLGGYALSPITPSGNNRMAILLPLYREAAAGAAQPAATALVAATYSGAMLFSPMLPTSKSANLAAVALLPEQVQEQFVGPFWLLAAAVAAVGVTLWHFGLMAWMFSVAASDGPARGAVATREDELPARVTPDEWLAAAGFGFFIVGIATVSWHHVQPAWVAGIVLVGLLLSGSFGRDSFRRQIDWPMLFFLLGVDCLVRIMDHLGLGAALADSVAGLYGFIDGRIERFLLAGLVTTLLVRLALPVTAGMLTATVILLPVAAAHGIHSWICVFVTALFSDIFFMPYQSSVYLQACSQAGETFDHRRFMTYNHGMNLARVAVAYASIPWWRWLGLL